MMVKSRHSHGLERRLFSTWVLSLFRVSLILPSAVRTRCLAWQLLE